MFKVHRMDKHGQAYLPLSRVQKIDAVEKKIFLVNVIYLDITSAAREYSPSPLREEGKERTRTRPCVAVHRMLKMHTWV